MSDSGAFSGAMMLSQQLSMYRWMDTIERAWSNSELAVDNALLRREAAEIVERYNQLVADFNDLLRQAIEAAPEADRRGSAIAELEHEVEALRRAKDILEAECERLRQENEEKGIEITFLRGTLRDQHPDRYPPEATRRSHKWRAW
jgi:chromosome segregation ATPase